MTVVNEDNLTWYDQEAAGQLTIDMSEPIPANDEPLTVSEVVGILRQYSRSFGFRERAMESVQDIYQPTVPQHSNGHWVRRPGARQYERSKS
jgi:hypothetical protein